MTTRIRLLIGLLVSVVWLTGCGRPDELITSPPPAIPSATSVSPSPTPKPSAALVNGDPIWLADLEDELLRFEAAQIAAGIDLATLGDYQVQVLQALIDRRLLAQGALSLGLEVGTIMVDQRLEQLAADLGGNEEMGAWLAENGYTLEGFKAALAEEMLASQMVERIVTEVQDAAEQVHARHILVSTREQADRIRDQLISGADFTEMARLNSIDPSTRPAGGDLGWFPRGYLLIPEVEIAAFSLQPGEVSEVIESILGYHIVQKIEQAVRPLSPDALRQMREQAVKNWLATQRETAEVQMFIAP